MSLWSRILGRLRAKDTGAVGSELSELWDETANTGAGVHVNSYTALQAVAGGAGVPHLSEGFAKVPPPGYCPLGKNGTKAARGHPPHRLTSRPPDRDTRFLYR